MFIEEEWNIFSLRLFYHHWKKRRESKSEYLKVIRTQEEDACNLYADQKVGEWRRKQICLAMIKKK